VAARHPHAQLISEFHDHQNRFYAGGEQEPVARMLAVDVAWHVPGASALAGDYRGRDEVLRYFTRRRQLADATFRIDVRGVLAQDERTVVIAQGEAEFDGERFAWGTVAIFRVADGRIAECWVVPHDLEAFDRIWSLAADRSPSTRSCTGATRWEGRSAGAVTPGSAEADTADVHEEEIESRFEATFAVGLVIGLQLALALVSVAGGWKLIGLPGWVWLIPAAPEAALLVALSWSSPRQRLEQMGRRREVALALVGVIAVANVLALAALLGSLLSAQEKSGGELLFKGGTIWSTNVLTFGLLFWEFDRGGPIRRRSPCPPPRDFQFPQDENPTLAEPNWQPGLADYVYVSFTNAIAFSPTDAMPLTRRLKTMMLAESAISAATVLLVAARAVNILH
jgi:ketosteroid isomerase-like protein